MFGRLRNFFKATRLDAEIREELDFHRSQTQGSFGNVTLIQERTRDESTLVWLDTFAQDLRFGLRQLSKSPLLVAVAVLSLALGIGGNTSVFTLIDAILMQSLPVREPARLALFYDGISTGVYSGDSFPSDIFSYPSWEYFKGHHASFEGLCAFRQDNDPAVLHISGSENTPQERATVHLVSGNYFSVLGVGPAIGRVLRDADDSPGAAPVAIITYNYWRERFHSDDAVLGKHAVLNGTSFTIVGVAAPEFFGERVGRPPDFWLPLSFQPQILQRESWLEARDVFWLNFMGRLAPGATLRSAESDATVQLHQFYLEQAGTSPSDDARRKLARVHVRLKPGGSGISGLRFVYSEPLHILMVIVAVVLLIACANVATLMLARASSRSQEFLARVALGASRSRLLRQMLTESMLLAGLGGIAGVALAWGWTKLLMALLHMNATVKVHPNPLLLGFTVAISLATGLISGIVPGIRLSRVAPRIGTAVRPAEYGNSRAGGAAPLIVLQVALSLVLLVSSGLLAHSLFAIERQDMGFRRDHILFVTTDPRLAGYQQGALFPLYQAINDQMNAIPGVVSASLARYTPLSGTSSVSNFSMENYTPLPGTQMSLHSVEVGPGFFETLGIPVLAGRPIGVRDTPASPRVAVVNETFVARYLPNQNPIGRHIMLGSPFSAPGVEVVGVVKDSKYYDLRDQSLPMAFFSIWQPTSHESHDFVYGGDIILRTAGDASSFAPEVRRVLGHINNQLAVLKTGTLDGQVEHSLEQQTMIASLTSIFGILALVLASIGIYGTVAFSVARRTTEIGIRMAIGAQRGSVLWMVLRDSVILITQGIIIGVPLALAATRWIKSFLFGVQPADPFALAAGVSVILLLAVSAAYVPARRATTIDPMSALRNE